ncbi:MAG: family 43 glycosylhydrolase [Lachnospirales bacterium]
MYGNYVGKWKSDLENGNYRNPILFSDYSDPDVIRVNNDFYMVASSFTYFPGVPVLHSTDLVNWRIISYAVEKMPLSKYDTPKHGCGVWAPSIRYYNDTFYVYFGDPDEGVFMAKTKDPFNKWEDTICVAKAKGWIDTCPFWDDDGSAYLIRGVAKSRIGYKSKLFLHKMSSDGTKLLDDGKLIFDGRINHPTIEGPKMYKRNGYYYIFAPAGGVQQGWQMMARSKNIYGPYEHRVILHQGDSPINGPHQGGLVELQNGESWFLHFQDLDAYGRIIHLQPCKWVNDWLEVGVDTNNDKIGEPVLEYKKPMGLVSEVILPVESDDFKGDRLSLQWQWQAHCNKKFYSLTGNSLILNAVSNDGENLSDAPNLLCELIKRPNFTVDTKINLKLEKGESCGLVITGGSYYGIKVTKSDEVIEVAQVSYELMKDCKTNEIISETKTYKADSIYLRLKVKYPGFISTYVSLDGTDFSKIGDDLFYNVSRKSWVGGKIGIFSVGKDKGYAEFMYLRVE